MRSSISKTKADPQQERPARGRGKSKKSLDLIEAAYAILAEIQPTSIRSVCYQLFNRGLIESMAKAETNKVSTQLTWAREQHIIPWSWVVDETRQAEYIDAWENPEAYADTVRRSYRRNRWTDQPDRIEVWSEKGTIRGTIAPVLHEYGLTFRVMHGYGSSTAIYQAAQDSLVGSKFLRVLYVGDWDPSGLHMSEEDLPRRIRDYGGCLSLQRLALNWEDVFSDQLPSFVAETKKHDPRYNWFTKHYGHRCWELDALSPNVLRERLKQAVRDRLDHDAWQRADVVERAERESLMNILSTWPGKSRQASEYPPEAGR